MPFIIRRRHGFCSSPGLALGSASQRGGACCGAWAGDRLRGCACSWSCLGVLSGEGRDGSLIGSAGAAPWSDLQGHDAAIVPLGLLCHNQR